MTKKIDRKVTINGTELHIRANSEQEYAEALILAATSKAQAAKPTQQKHDFAEYARNWFQVFSMPNIERATREVYRSAIERNWIPGLRGKCVEDVMPADIQQVLNDMGDRAKETKLKSKRVVQMIFNQAVEDDIIMKNPALSKSIKIKGKSSRETKPYSIEQMRYIIEHIKDVKEPADRAFISLLALHPLRQEEALGLQYGDIDFERGTMTIRRAVTHPERNVPEIKATKTEASKRTLFLAKTAAQWIGKGPDSDFIVGGESPVSYTQVQHMCARIRKQMGFEEKITPLRFRTTVLSDIYNMTKDIKVTQAAAGHTTAAMTLKHYVKVREAACDNVQPLMHVYGLSENGMHK